MPDDHLPCHEPRSSLAGPRVSEWRSLDERAILIVCSVSVNAPASSPPGLNPETLLDVASLIERRITELDRLGPPNARGYACNACRDGELHRLLGIIRGMASQVASVGVVAKLPR